MSEKKERVSSGAPAPRKRVVFTQGGKGGVGKTGFMIHLAEWFVANQIPFTLLDLDILRLRLRKKKLLKLKVRNNVGKAYDPEEKARLIATAKTARSPHM